MHQRHDSVAIIVLITILFSTLAGGATGQMSGTIKSDSGIIYLIEFNKNQMSVSITGRNPTDQRILTGITVRADGAVVVKKDHKILPDERWEMNRKLYPAIDVSLDVHSLIVSTYGSQTTFNFTWDINSTNSGQVPTPYIKNVKIANGTIDGEPSAVAEVTVANPSKQTYPTKLMVHTVDTHGSFYPAAVPPGETRTITVELLDERGSKIAGEARLYTEGLNKREGAMDQVEFVGRAGSETGHWNTSYQPVRPPWKDDPYRYRNSSISTDGSLLPSGDDVGLLYVAAGAVLLLWSVRKLR